jgi:hypothetical protein
MALAEGEAEVLLTMDRLMHSNARAWKRALPLIRLPGWLVPALLFLAQDALAQPQRVNLAKLQAVQASSSADGDPAVYATDGIVGNGNRWKSDGAAPQWLIVRLPLALELGSAHLYLGRDDTEQVSSFSLQCRSGSTWANIPGATVSGNASNVLNLVFTSPVTTSQVRLFSNESVVRVREIALFAPGGPEGYPIGTDVTLNLAKKRPVAGSSTDGSNFPNRAVDGYADDASRWKSADVEGPHVLEIDLEETSRIGSAHLYSGSSTSPAISEFTLKAWNGSEWAAIPGGAVTGNADPALRLKFTAPVSTSEVRLEMPGSGSQRVRELLIFAADGGDGYPLGTDVILEPPPAARFDDYGDAYYKIVNRANPHSLIVDPTGASQTEADTTEEGKLFQILYNIDSDTYRLRNRDSYSCIGAKGAGDAPGTAVVEMPDYQGLPHELWRLQDVGGGDFRILNVWSGLALETDGGSPAAVTLARPADSTLQHWRFDFAAHYPKKGTGGSVSDWARFGVGWNYNWGRDPDVSLPSQVVFSPMQHNRWWPDWNTLPEYYPAWHTANRPVCLLGFNEPDHTDQANMTVADVIALWPKLEACDVPLVSPVTANAFGGWLGDFYDQAGSRGFRVDYTAAHWYGNPNASDLIGLLQAVNDTWGRPVWLTEFSCVDWGGNATWTEEDNCRFIAEFLWRAEDLSWLKRYAIFLFSGEPPANPWDRSGPRSDMLRSDGATLTAFGEIYAAWDADRTIREKIAYLLQNRSADHRLSNAAGDAGPGASTIRTSGVSVQWALVKAPAAGRWTIVSLRDGRRLRWTGTKLDYAPPGTAGSAVEWGYSADADGYFFIDHPATSKRLRMNRVDDANGAPTSITYVMEASSTVRDSVRWRFIKPYKPADVEPPPAPASLAATGGESLVTLSWPSTGTTDFLGYSVYRSMAAGGPYTRIAANLKTSDHVDTNVTNGTTYHYVVTVMDWIENESANSPEASATPVEPGEKTEFIRGDVDGDGELDISDPIKLLGFLFLGEPQILACFDAADSDDSGDADLSDAIYGLTFLFLGGPAPKAPFPSCGAEAAADELDCQEYRSCP